MKGNEEGELVRGAVCKRRGIGFPRRRFLRSEMGRTGVEAVVLPRPQFGLANEKLHGFLAGSVLLFQKEDRGGVLMAGERLRNF